MWRHGCYSIMDILDDYRERLLTARIQSWLVEFGLIRTFLFIVFPGFMAFAIWGLHIRHASLAILNELTVSQWINAASAALPASIAGLLMLHIVLAILGVFELMAELLVDQLMPR